MMTTHNMPLNYLVDQLKEDVGEVIFLGIQPDIVGFYYPMTQPVKEAVARVYQQLADWQGRAALPGWRPQTINPAAIRAPRRRATGLPGAPLPAAPAQDSLSLIYRVTPRL